MAQPMSTVAAAPTRRAQRPDWIEVGGLAVVGTAAVVLSFSALAGLGMLVGFGSMAIFGWDFPLSLLIPLCVDAYGATAGRIATNRAYSAATRHHAMIHSVIAIGVGILGNAAYHLLEGGVVDLGGAMWVLVVVVSIIPAVALGALVHLMSECARDRQEAARACEADKRAAAAQRVAERERAEQEAASQRAAEQAAAERLAAERRAAEEAAAARAEAERQAAEALAETERQAAERAHAERQAAAERAEAERLAAERARAEQAAAEQTAAAEQARTERLAAAERVAAEQRAGERERAEREAAERRFEAERKEAERQARAERQAERKIRAEQAERGDLPAAEKKSIILAELKRNPAIKARVAAEAVVARGGQMSEQRARAVLAELRQEEPGVLAHVRQLRSPAAV